MELKNLVIFGLKYGYTPVGNAIMNQHADNFLSEQKKACYAIKYFIASIAVIVKIISIKRTNKNS